MSYNTQLQTNNTNLQSILDTINALPDAGTDLPELTNQGTASDLLSGKELIDQDGNIVTGTFTIDNEVNTQEDLLAELQTALAGKTAGSGDTEIDTCTVTIKNGALAYYTTFSEDGIMHGTNKQLNSSFDSITVVKKTVFTINSHYTILRVSTTPGIQLISNSGSVSIYELLATASDTETIELVLD